MSDNHKAIVARITITELPEGKTLNLGTVLGYNVLVGKSFKTGDFCLLFTDDLRLSAEFAKANDLIRRKDEQGNNVGGYFEENCRVKAKRFMGQKSEAFACELHLLAFTGYDLSKLKEGDLLDELNGIPICSKYFTPKTAQTQGSGKTRSETRGQTIYFPKHLDTTHFQKFAGNIPIGSIIYLTEKQHGTSQRVGYILDPQTKWWHKFLPKFLQEKQQYKFQIGTRNVMLSEHKEDGYYSTSFREKAAAIFKDKMHKGEIFYYEIVGYTDSRPIMGTVSTEKDKQALKKWGPSITYNYGCKDGEFALAVYRISLINEDGIRHELGWEAVKDRCQQIGVPHVKEVHPPFIYDGNEENLRKLVEDLTENRPEEYFHPNEGVCLRYEKGLRFGIMKSKSFIFKLLEGIIKDNPNYVDVEEVS